MNHYEKRIVKLQIERTDTIEKLQEIVKAIYVPELSENEEGTKRNLLVINDLNLIINKLSRNS